LGCGDVLRETAATNAFAAMGTNALPVLQAALTRDDSRFRRFLVGVQVRFPRLGLDFFSLSARVGRQEALIAATVLGTNALPILMEVTEEIGECGCYDYVEYLASFNVAAVKPIAVAVTNCGSEHSERALLESLRSILAANQLSSADEELVIAACTRVLQNNWDEFVDREAAYAIGTFGAKAERAIPALLDCLANRQPKSSYAAAWALGRIGCQPRIVLPALLRAMGKDHFCTVRAEAVRAVGDFGADATHLVPVLLRLTRDREADVRDGALTALMKIDPTAWQTSSALKRGLRDRNAAVRMKAAKLSRTGRSKHFA
jgi:hypothetical protein